MGELLNYLLISRFNFDRTIPGGPNGRLEFLLLAGGYYKNAGL
jgi:hypothetical protein